LFVVHRRRGCCYEAGQTGFGLYRRVERGIDCAGGSGSASSDSSTLFDAAEQVLAQTDLRLGGQRTIPDGASRVSTRTRALASARLLG
jgi:hypothetical protein